jgi:hypothetical protein
MTVLTSETTFTVQAAPAVYEESEILCYYPENVNFPALRQLHYPGGVFAPIIYESNPDRWENFDSAPMTARPQVKTELTIASAQVVQWPGYLPDRSVKEIWKGSENTSRMTIYMLRRLYEYYANPPLSGYISWYPLDRTTNGYSIQIEGLHVGGQDVVSFDFVALYQGDLVPFEVIFQFRIIG